MFLHVFFPHRVSIFTPTYVSRHDEMRHFEEISHMELLVPLETYENVD